MMKVIKRLWRSIMIFTSVFPANFEANLFSGKIIYDSTPKTEYMDKSAFPDYLSDSCSYRWVSYSL
jgi:hypothetical protein